MIRALVFDFDGLILDTEGPEFQSWQEIYASHGATLALERWAAGIGTVDGFDPYADLQTQTGRAIDRDAIHLARQRRTDELIAAEGLRPGVSNYLDRAGGLGLRLAVASSSPRRWVAGHLERLGILDRFQLLRCSDDVRRVKPDPELYASAVSALDVEPAEAIAIEDSPNGVLAAKRAGLFCVAVPNPLTRQLALDHADLLLESLTEMPLERLLSHCRAALDPQSGPENPLVREGG